jgi:hypothetical protein
MYRTSAYLDPGGEAHAANNVTMTTPYGPPVVQDFQSFDASGGFINAFHRPGDATYQCPAPSDWATHSDTTMTYVGDKWPQASEATAASNPTYAQTVQHYLFGTTNNATYASNTHPRSSQAGPGGGAFDPANGSLGTNIAQSPSTNNEWRPFNTGTFYGSRIDQVSGNNPFRQGSLGPGYIPNANNGTSPEMAFKVAYNEFSSASGFYGRRGAAKVSSSRPPRCPATRRHERRC